MSPTCGLSHSQKMSLAECEESWEEVDHTELEKASFRWKHDRL